MKDRIKRILTRMFILTALMTFYQCSEKPTKPSSSNSLSDQTKYVDVLSKEQESAFDALNELQINTDEMNRLYSTFAGISHPCYPPDSTFSISQTDLLEIMKQFVNNHCTQLNEERRNRLAKLSVLAQQEYTVFHCRDNETHSESNLNGTWVMPNVLGRRDVLIVW